MPPGRNGRGRSPRLAEGAVQRRVWAHLLQPGDRFTAFRTRFTCVGTPVITDPFNARVPVAGRRTLLVPTPLCSTFFGGRAYSRQRSPSAFAAVDTFMTRRRSRFLTGTKW